MADASKAVLPFKYQRYKNDTAAFLTWLLRAALCCGYQIDALEDKSEENERSGITISVASRRIPVREILTQAEIVCRKDIPSSYLPRGVARLAERAIATREDFTRHFEAQGQSSTNESHKFFAETLKKALHLLNEHAKQARRHHPSGTFSSPRSKKEDDNIYASLYVDESHQDLDELAQDMISGSTVPTPSGSQTNKQNNSPEMTVVAEDVCMRILCFFSDIQQLRFQVLHIWALNFLAPTLDPIALAAMTHAALAFAEQMEYDLLHDLLPGDDPLAKSNHVYGGIKSAYSVINGLFVDTLHGDGIQRSVDPGMIFGPPNHFFLCDIALILSKFSAAMLRREEQKKTFKNYQSSLATATKENPPPLDVWPRVETMEMIFLTQSKFQEEIGGPDWKLLTDNDEFLTSVLIDTCLRAEQLVELPGSKSRALFEDPLSKTILQLREGKVSVAAILGATILFDLDTHLTHIGRKTLLYNKLLDYADHSWDLVKHAQLNGKTASQYQGPAWRSRDLIFPAIITQARALLHDEGNGWSVFQDTATRWHPPWHFQLEPDEKFWIQRLGTLPIDPHTEGLKRIDRLYALKHHYMLGRADKYRLWTGNPVACATMLHNLSLAREEAGISLANRQLSILSTAYLYTALRTHGFLSREWKAIEDVIMLNTDSMFFGSVPEDPIKRYRTWSLRCGNLAKAGAEAMALGRGGLGRDDAGRLLSLVKAGASCLALSNASHSFAKWIQGEETTMRTVHAVNNMMELQKGPRSSKKKLPMIDPLNFLQHYAESIDQHCKRASIDYISMTRNCTDLLQCLLDAGVLDVFLNSELSSTAKVIKKQLASTWRSLKLEDRPESIIFITECLLWQDKSWFEKKSKAKKDRRDGDETKAGSLRTVGSSVEKHLHDRGLLILDDTKKDVSASESSESEDLFDHASFARKLMDEHGMLVQGGQKGDLMETMTKISKINFDDRKKGKAKQ